MASARNAICMLKSRHFNLIYTSRRGQSSLISRSNRNTIKCGRRATQQQQRRSVLSGKTIIPQANDIVRPQIPSSFSSRAQKQQRRRHQFLNDKNEDVNKSSRMYESDLVVVLDMDECLIHSHFLQGPGAEYAHQVKRKSSPDSPAGATANKTLATFDITLPDGERVVVHERPHLHKFLKEVSSKYETHIFTAAMEVYAKPVLEVLDPHGTIFSGIWYRESCQLDLNLGAYIKNLELLCESYDNDQERQQRLNRTVLVDNNPLSFLANPEHGILVSSFYTDSRDTTLPAVLELLHELDKHEDVRPVLNKKFQLQQVVDDILLGRPLSGRLHQIDEQQSDESTIVVAT